MSLDKTKQVETEYHDRFYDGEEPLPPVTVEEVERTLLQPCYTTGNDHYSDNKRAFHRLIHKEGGWAGRHVLDYACGFGQWAVYYALTGAGKVDGFDISQRAVVRGGGRVAAQGLQDRVNLEVMDATTLGYAPETFDIVIGHGVIHHVIKYPGIFEELHRVMKPGARAYFLEGLADFPLFRLWWLLKGTVPQGDVPIFAKDIREKTSMFSDLAIHGDDFMYSMKHFLWKEGLSPARRGLLRAVKKTDDFLFFLLPFLRRWGSFSYIVLTK